MLFVKFLFTLVLCLLVSGKRNGKKVIDIDYYGRGLLRHTRVDMNCDLELHKQYCRFKCSKSHAVCIKGNCYCVKENTTGLLPGRNLHKPEDLPSIDSSEEDLFHDGHPLNFNYEPKIPNSRPIRRHHIAHFCPNLDDARACIRKCMPQGKPAFCGKDHVCYCGHKYKSSKKEKENRNITAIYAQFKDLYAKYFGVSEEDDDLPIESGTIVEPWRTG